MSESAEILNEEFLKSLGLTANVSTKSIQLGTFFKTSAEFWMNLQMIYDL